MELQLVNKEQAVRLKALAFGWDCDFYYHKDSNMPTSGYTNNLTTDRIYISCPAVALALKWLREVKCVYVYPELSYTNGQQDWLFVMHLDYYKPFVLKDTEFKEKMYASNNYKTYEEAESAGLDAALEYLEKTK